MNNKELKQYRQLKIEIDEEVQRVSSMRSGKSRRAAAEIDKKLNRLYMQQMRIEKYISDVSDPLVRRIMVARYIECRSWEGVARKLGGRNTAESVRKICERWIRNNP
ncbi:MAG: hypothetical protein ACI4QZ_09515 [Eubacteriales bacterium]